MKIALDWDGTLVDENQEWLPGALDALRWFKRNKHRVVIHSARANWEGGKQEIEGKLAQHFLPFKVYAKPEADIYVDNRAIRFAKSWPQVIREVREQKRAKT